MILIQFLSHCTQEQAFRPYEFRGIMGFSPTLYLPLTLRPLPGFTLEGLQCLDPRSRSLLFVFINARGVVGNGKYDFHVSIDSLLQNADEI